MDPIKKSPRIIRRGIDAALVLALAVGAVWAWRLGSERTQLQAIYQRLVAKTGNLEGGDPSKILIQALPTGKPMQFAWHVHIPPGPFAVRSRTGGSSSHTSFTSKGEETIFRVGFRETAGRFDFDYSARGGGSSGVIGSPAFAKLIRDHWDEILIEQAGQGELIAADPAKPLVLLRLKLPPNLVEEVKSELSDQDQQRMPVLYELDKP